MRRHLIIAALLAVTTLVAYGTAADLLDDFNDPAKTAEAQEARSS